MLQYLNIFDSRFVPSKERSNEMLVMLFSFFAGESSKFVGVFWK
jgi:hypothetical protein